ncbi:Hypothetical protein, putative [Bodo saltans]|uniref:SET domain-containing protein n=1 Tax=Bodo saltans TaxID=75058 RepID=A0A0S4JG13_BODSA|nr:Hypothetical protein, putative [Bodo saltans]|eukprot:CUG90398.1 Hypothetical protein, putative [Bodo saltans]
MRRWLISAERYHHVVYLLHVAVRCGGSKRRASDHTPHHITSLAELLRDCPVAVDSARLTRRKVEFAGGAPGICAASHIPAGSLLAVIPISCVIAPATTNLNLGDEIANELSAAVMRSSPGSDSTMHDVSLVSCAAALHLMMLRATSTRQPMGIQGEVIQSSSNPAARAFVGKYLDRIAKDCDVVGNRAMAARSFRSAVMTRIMQHTCDDGGDSTSLLINDPRSLEERVEAECERYEQLSRCREDSIQHLDGVISYLFSSRFTKSHHQQLPHLIDPRLRRAIVDEAHGLCESRCVTIPNGGRSLGGGRGGAIDQHQLPSDDDDGDELRCDDDTGGPAFVPFIDLVNHRSEEPNVAIACITDPDEIERMLRIASRRRFLNTHALSSEVDSVDGLLPVVVAVAAADIAATSELHYQYDGGSDGATTTTTASLPTCAPANSTISHVNGISLPEWALRFHFIP